MAARIIALSALMLAACLDPMDRELTECHPNCHPDSGTPDFGVHPDAETQQTDSGEQHQDVDAGGMDAEPHDAAEPPPPPPLEASEVTPHQITWSWGADSVPAQVAAYRLRVALTRDQIPTVDPWDETDDPNLAYRTSPLGPGVVTRTRMLDLAPSTTYFARLYGLMEAGGEVVLAEGSATTPAEPLSELLIFDEDLPLEAALDIFRDPTTASQAYHGASALWFESAGLTTATASNLQRAIPPALSEAWQEGYLELFVLVSPDHPIAYVEVMLSGFAVEIPPYRYFALPPRADWERLEIPLALFAASPMTESVDAFGIRASWGDATTVFVDAVTIRY